MALTVPNVGKQYDLDKIIAAGSIYLHLYKNAVTISRATVFGDLTVPVGGWYSTKLTSGWPASTIDANNKASATAAKETWTVASTVTIENIVGYALTTSSGGGTILAIEAFASGAVPMGTIGDKLELTPNLTVKSEVNN